MNIKKEKLNSGFKKQLPNTFLFLQEARFPFDLALHLSFTGCGARART